MSNEITDWQEELESILATYGDIRIHIAELAEDNELLKDASFVTASIRMLCNEHDFMMNEPECYDEEEMRKVRELHKMFRNVEQSLGKEVSHE